MLTKKEIDTIKHIRNFLVHEGEMPTYRKLMAALGYKSPRSVTLLVNQLIKKKILKKTSNGRIRMLNYSEENNGQAQTISVPLLGRIACGRPLLAEENIEGMIPVSIKLARLPHKYFLLKTKGDSMNEKGINDGDLVLVRQQNTANNGDLVVALIDGESTIKEFIKSEGAIILKPRSSNKNHKPIILTQDFQIQGIVVSVIKGL
ncbi:MAG: transcriptional repressor LexA [Elusimicrobiota bacterium]